MLTRLSMIAVVGLFTLTAMGLNGCETAKQAGVSYDLGTMSAKVPAPFTQVVSAATSTLNDYGVAVKDLDKQDDQAHFKGETKAGSPVTLNLKKVNDTHTEMKLSTGAFGNYQESLKMAKSIYDKLGLIMP